MNVIFLVAGIFGPFFHTVLNLMILHKNTVCSKNGKKEQ